MGLPKKCLKLINHTAQPCGLRCSAEAFAVGIKKKLRPQQLVVGWLLLALHADRLRHLHPSLVPLPFQPAKVYSRNSKAAVVQELADFFYRLSSIAAELSSRVAEDVDASGLHICQPEVALKVAVERAAACCINQRVDFTTLDYGPGVHGVT